MTRQGVPVCFFVTDAERTPIISQWLNWVVGTVANHKVRRIMIDCSPTEIAAIKSTFGNGVDILLCHWHIRHAWEMRMKKEVCYSSTLIRI